jgi:hypothetical protein
MHAQQLLILVIVKLEIALARVVQGFAQVAGEVNVRGRDEDSVIGRFDLDDPGQRMLGLGLFLVMPDEGSQFFAMLEEIGARNVHEAGRKVVATAMAGRTYNFGCAARALAPLPATGMKKRPARRAYRRFWQLVL